MTTKQKQQSYHVMMNKTLHIFSLILLLIGVAANAYAQTINGNIYGGGEKAKVDGNTEVIIIKGKLGADIFGGGEGKLYDTAEGDHAIGDVCMSADVSGETHVTINGGEFAVKAGTDDKPFAEHYNIYGGGNVASAVGNTHVYVTKGMIAKNSDGTGNFLKNSNPQGIAQAYYHEGQMYFCVFGGGYGKNTSVTGNTWVDFNIGDGDGIKDITETNIEDDLLEYQSYLDVIGGGFNGTVQGNTNVHVGGNAMCRNVYGGGLYATIGTEGQSTKGKTNVHITGGNIDNVYGGGVMGDILTATNVNIGLASALDFDGRNYAIDNGKVTILMSVYGANDVSGHVPQVNITHNGGTIDQNIYGAGNGDYHGYYTPNLCDYADGENDNYFIVNHKDGIAANNGKTYKGRPQTDNVNITMGGNSNSDKAVVLGQVFGGGNSCTIGTWKTIAKGDKHDGDPHVWRDDPEFFEGGGKLNVKINSHVKIGYDNTTLASASDDIKEMYTRDNENVSGLFMGCSGNALATQTTNPNDYDYHHYYDATTKKYWPGFAVFDNSGNPLSREEGLKSFKAYLNNILIWSNDVTLSIDNAAEDIWLANFVGGGFRGSMKRKDGNAYQWTLPAGVTVGNCVVGGAYNTDVVYRVFDTESDMHTYKTQDGHYLYRTELKPEWKEGEDYHHLEKDAGGNTIAIVRFYFDGGILSNDGSTTKDITKLTLANAMNASDTSKRRIFAGCFTSGTTKGNTVIDYTGTGAPRIHGGGAYAHVAGDATVNIQGGVAGDVYGGGSLADVKGSTSVNLTGGTVTNTYGGGLGDANTSALVYGDATTTLNGSKVNGSVFGANNVNGTPLGHVKVHVLKTKESGGAYHVAAVYGGGNQAAYVPTGSYNTEGCLTDKTKFAEVVIEGCDNSIEYVYGGGNAAPVPATDVTIYGANAIDNAFAGGNGKGDGNKGADIGYLGFYSETKGETPTYGSGETHITIYGGTVNNVFGGSNTLGYIRTHAAVDVPEIPGDYEGAKCELHLGSVHAGGNQAEMFCGGSVKLACSEGAQNLYAGANNADIHGDIDLVINSGTYGKVFGGNNASGNIFGHIKIDIDETGCFPIMIGELYGCGNDAAYSVYGYNNDGTCKTEGEKKYDDPTINIYSCTSIGKIFGGGKGIGAKVYGNPHVNINTIKGRWAGCSVENSDPKKQMPAPAFRLDADGNRVE
ncbi:MAG: hypothetical protein KBT34_13775, partial [Prevotella sp.]|nr:hypothetical protein [Candidatus Prevotella equi]